MIGTYAAVTALNLTYLSDDQHSCVKNITFEKMFGIF